MSETPRILLHIDDTQELAAQLVACFPDAEFAACTSYADLPAMIQDYRPEVMYAVRFAGTEGYPREAVFAKDGPRWVSNGGAGVDHFGHWDTARVTVTNAAGAAADMMAEYVMGCFLHFTLDVPGLQADKAAQVWQSRQVIPLQGKTLLIAGLGSTGQAIARRAKAFGMQVIGTRARPRDMENVDEVGAADALLALLPRADFIAVSTPLTHQTKGLIGWPEFDAMKPGVILADVSRGGVIDQDALLQALQRGTVAAAALDVFEAEPLPVSSPLWHADNLIISPHCSSVSAGWALRSFDLFLENLKRWCAGQTLTNIVDPTRGY